MIERRNSVNERRISTVGNDDGGSASPKRKESIRTSGSNENMSIHKTGSRNSLKNLRSQSDDLLVSSLMEDEKCDDALPEIVLVDKIEEIDPRKYSDVNIRNKVLKQKLRQDGIRNIQQSRGIDIFMCMCGVVCMYMYLCVCGYIYVCVHIFINMFICIYI
jgi:hypothetical protein